MDDSEILITTIKGLQERVEILRGEMLDAHLLTNTQGLVNESLRLDDALASEGNIQVSIEMAFALSNFRLAVSRVREAYEHYQKAIREISAIEDEIFRRRRRKNTLLRKRNGMAE